MTNHLPKYYTGASSRSFAISEQVIRHVQSVIVLRPNVGLVLALNLIMTNRMCSDTQPP